MMEAEQIRQYFERRLQGQRFPNKVEVKLRCPFHDDQNPSMSVNLEKGVWQCHTGCGGGGLLDFEMKFSGCDLDTAKVRVAEVLGDKQAFFFSQKPEAVYQYHDANGRLVLEKVRYPGKRFVQRKPNGKNRWEYKLSDCQKPLYRLPEVLVANEVFVCEGEKDADNVRALNLGNRGASIFVAATTNFDGAGKWRDAYAPYFLGKKVVIFADNDEPGRKHAEQVARSVYPHVAGVKVVALPGLPDKGDVSDYLKSHSAEDLVSEIKKAPQWHPPHDAATDSVLVSVPDFITSLPVETDWLIDGIVERGANGFLCAVPKGGKSWAAIDIAISLATGSEWLGFRVPRAAKVALISREDNPALTSWRLRHLSMGKANASRDLLNANLYVNSRAQTPELMLDNPEQVENLKDALKRRGIEFAIFDVFNVMHAADENDAQEMRAVLRELSRIQAEVGCGIAVVHHFNKLDGGTMTQRLRGSSAIAGWAEWLIGISMAEEERKIRRMDFELKADCPPDSVHYRIVTGDGGAIRLERESYFAPAPAKSSRREGSAAERYIAN